MNEGDAEASYGIPVTTTMNPHRKCLMKPPCRLASSALARPTSARLTTLLSAALTLCLLASPGEVLAKRQKESPAASEGAKRKGATKVTYQRSSSEESSAERDRRLYRECKGMHNAGACRGYTHK